MLLKYFATFFIISCTFVDSKVDLLPAKKACAVLPFEVIQVQGFIGPMLLINSYLFPVLLEYKKDGTSNGFHCGGAVISDRYILTAAHCVTGDVISTYGKPFRARLGEYNRKTKKDIAIYYDFEEKDNLEEIEIEEIVPHYKYNISDVNRYNDIALIRLKHKYTKKEFIQPICFDNREMEKEDEQEYMMNDKLEEKNKDQATNKNQDKNIKNKREKRPNETEDKVNKKEKDSKYNEARKEIFVVLGWSVTENNDGRHDKRFGFMETISNEECSKHVNITLIESQFCAIRFGEIPPDGLLDQTCHGDSGGAIVRHGKGADYYLSGIDSIRITKCDQKFLPIVYTNATQFLPWIYANIKP